MSKNDGLPKGWAQATIDDLLVPLEDGRTLHHGWSPQCEKGPSPSDEEWGVLKTTAVQDGAFLPEHNKRLPDHLSPRPHFEVKEGDILITCAGPRKRCGVPCMVRKTRPRLIISGKMYRFRVPDGLVDSRYVEAMLRSQDSQEAIDRMKTGINDSGLNLTHGRFRPLPVRVAPFKEQRRIVAKIEELFSDLDAGVAALKRVQANLSRYRAAVLKSAVEGKLTRQWRKANPDTEPADKLLKRILTERRKNWETQQLANYKAKDQNPPKNWKDKYKEPVAPDTTNLPKLPKGWCWATADQLTDETRAITYGVVKLGKPTDGGVPILRSSNVRALRLSLDYVKPISHQIAKKYTRTSLNGGELLVTVRGTLGGIAVVPPSCRGFNISREVAMLALIEPRLGPPLALFIASRPIQNWIMRHTRGIAYTGINIKTLKEMPLPLAPLGELERIVELADGVLSFTDQFEHDVERCEKRSARLRQAILKRAFEGRLVPQDPNDEPASVLLERIAAERKKSLPPPKPSRRRRKTS